MWSQQFGAVVLSSVVSDARLQSSLADDSKRITAANGALYELMTAQAAGGSASASQTAINAVLAQLDSVKSSLQTLSASVPAAQQAGFKGVLSDLANYRGGVNCWTALTFHCFLKEAMKCLPHFSIPYCDVKCVLPIEV